VALAALTATSIGASLSAQDPVDVLSYSFSIRIPDTGSVISAVAEITYRGGGEDPLRLDLVGLTVDSVRAAQHAVPFTYDGQTIQIPAPRPDGPVAVFYHGAPRDGLIIQTNARGHRSAFGDNWPERARAWLPTVDAPRDKARVRFTVTAPSGWRVVANGTPDACHLDRNPTHSHLHDGAGCCTVHGFAP
jgi:aminopeptidase N